MIIAMSRPTKTQAARKTRSFIWSYRERLVVACGVVFLISLTTAIPWWIMLLIWAAIIGLAVWQRENILPYTHRRFYGAKVRRDLERAARDSGFGEIDVENVEITLPGEWLDVRVPRGKTVDELERKSDAMAGCLRVENLHVLPGKDKSHANISVIRRNSFLTMDNAEWPLLNAEFVDIRKGIPFGRNEYGRQFDVRLLSRNLMFGGAPDSGKSSALRMIAAAAALDRKVKLWMMDGKTAGAEFIHWTSAAENVIRGRDVEAAVEMFAKIEERVDERSREIVARGEVFVCEDMELDVLIIDELPQFMRIFENDTKTQQSAVKAIRQSIWKLIAVGRWAGMITVLSAQKPTADIVPSESRDLIDHRFALHCNTRQMSDAILGDGSGDSPANAAEIPSGQPGVGYYISDNGVEKIRSYHISHKQALEIAERVGQRKLDEDLSTLTA